MNAAARRIGTNQDGNGSNLNSQNNKYHFKVIVIFYDVIALKRGGI